MKILVIGTPSFIGFHLAKKLFERGDEIVGLDNINDYYDVNLKYARLAEPFDVVVNLAAQAGMHYSIENPHAYIESNVISMNKRVVA